MSQRDSVVVECLGNTLLVKPLITPPSMQNREMKATLFGLVSTNGNHMPDANRDGLPDSLSWTFTVNQNRLVWEASNATVTTYEGTAASVTARLRNYGGKPETFEIAPTENWIAPMQHSGSVPPGGVQEITFVISDQLNAGERSTTVYAVTPAGSEPLLVQLTVLFRPPEWVVKPSEFEHSMPITCQYEVDSALSSDANDLIAAFVGSECRGITNIQFVPGPDVHRAFLAVYGNNRFNETVTFRAWDASSGRIFIMAEKLSFDPSQTCGTLLSPLILHPASRQQNIPVSGGWTWFSLNTRASNMKPDSVLRSVAASSGDILKDQTRYWQYGTSSGWVGPNEQLRIGAAVQAAPDKSGNIRIEGASVRVDTPIAVQSGWNWIGYLPGRFLDVNEALLSLTGSAEGDIVKDQHGFAVHDVADRWHGNLGVMRPGSGYMLKTGNSGTLIYPGWSAFHSPRGDGESLTSFMKADHKHGWEVSPHRFEYTMNLTSALMMDGLLLHDTGVTVAAFSGSECRGIAYPLDVEGTALHCFTIYSNTAGDSLRFLMYMPSRDTVFEARESVAFFPDDVVGTPVAPYLLRISGTTSAYERTPETPRSFELRRNHPNPFNPGTEIEYVLPVPGWARIDVSDALGNHVARLVDARHEAGVYTARFDAGSLPSGVYSYTLYAGSYVKTMHMLLVK
ncbi:MAG: hypothetical protein IPP94_13975 [Ignavibacteria bacterium]|nr:hypothetical protein [Ignavibacteria bacterium]